MSVYKNAGVPLLCILLFLSSPRDDLLDMRNHSCMCVFAYFASLIPDDFSTKLRSDSNAELNGIIHESSRRAHTARMVHSPQSSCLRRLEPKKRAATNCM
mmetsp:Transcript_17479/g.37905  ORF Transcript_17479/g.37905 Transcript_17479/m.37905 type:complete len:100 (-) Transcript_17479:230-529(-)